MSDSELLINLTRPYEIDYLNEGGDIATCTVTPGETWEEVTADGWPLDGSEKLKESIAARLLDAIAADADDGHLVLSADEMRHVDRVSNQTLTQRRIAKQFTQMVNDWPTTAPDPVAEQLRERQGDVFRRLSHLSRFIRVIGSENPDVAREMNRVLSAGFETINVARCEQLEQAARMTLSMSGVSW